MYVQVVLARLKPGSSRERFIALTEQMLDWLKAQPGFVAYELYECAEGWFDRIAWQDEASCREGLRRFLDTSIAARMVPLVEDGYISRFGLAVVTGTKTTP